MEDSTLQKLLDVLFGEDDGTDVDAVLVLDMRPDPLAISPPTQYVARLVGLEGEALVEMIVGAQNGQPPETVDVAYTKPASLIKWEGDPRSVCFTTVRYRLSTVCGYNIAYYQRETPAWGGDD